jgi:hypothetical protein
MTSIESRVLSAYYSIIIQAAEKGDDELIEIRVSIPMNELRALAKEHALTWPAGADPGNYT